MEKNIRETSAMQLAPRLKMHLDTMGIAYALTRHRPTATASETAQAAHVPGARLAKAVLLIDDRGPLLAVLPSTQHIAFGLLNPALGRHLDLAPEPDAARVFFDCAVGALPPAGAVYGVDMVVDAAFAGADEVFLEAGDHEHVVRVDAEGFRLLTRHAPRVDFAVHGATPSAEPAAERRSAGPATAGEPAPRKARTPRRKKSPEAPDA
jgi:Ala-tRNA(Pro) deacylase